MKIDRIVKLPPGPLPNTLMRNANVNASPGTPLASGWTTGFIVIKMNPTRIETDAKPNNRAPRGVVGRLRTPLKFGFLSSGIPESQNIRRSALSLGVRTNHDSATNAV